MCIILLPIVKEVKLFYKIILYMALGINGILINFEVR